VPTSTTAEAQRSLPTSTRKRSPQRFGLAVIAVLVVTALLALAVVGIRSWRGDGWKPVWSDDFDGASGTAPAAGSWLLDTGTGYPGGAAQWGTGEIQTYTTDPANIALDGTGNLRITPTRDASGAWQSGRMESRRADFQPPAGGKLKVEARIKVPAGGPGYWAAFWMLGAPFRPSHTDWPGAGEIDVMEHLGSEPSTVHGTLHCGVFDGGPCRETDGLGASRNAKEKPFTAGFHTYTVEWDRSLPTEEIRWYVDGTQFHTVRATDVDRTTWDRATGHGFYLLLNVAIGGGWPGPPDASTRPGQSMLVDRVSVARKS
jgi:hypothetical protein